MALPRGARGAESPTDNPLSLNAKATCRGWSTRTWSTANRRGDFNSNGVLGMGVTQRDFAEHGTGGQCFGSDFHKLSHDFRTPLNSICGFAELLLMDDGLSPAHADYVRAILTGSAALSTAVFSFLDHAERSDPGQTVSPEARPARSLFNRARRSVSPFRRPFARKAWSGAL